MYEGKRVGDVNIREVGGKKTYASFGGKFSPQVESRWFRAMRWIFCCDKSRELKTKVGKFRGGWRERRAPLRMVSGRREV